MDELKVLHHGDLWAVFVGVNEYDDPDWGDLPYCEKDATDVASVFIDPAHGSYPANNIRLLVGSAKRRSDKPTRHNIMQAIKHLAAAVETADNDDCVLFGFFGHGGEKDGIAYIFPSDGYKSNPEDTAIELRWVQETLQNCMARFKILIFDTCRNDVGGRGAETMPEAFARTLELLGQSEGWAVLSACKQGERSHDSDEKQHGAFTYHLLEGLNGAADADHDGLVTVYEASRYASLHTKRWAFRNGVQQNPECWSKVSGDIVLVQSGNGKMPPLGSDDNGDRRRDRWSKLKSITLRHCGEVSVNMWIDEPGEVSRREAELRIDEFIGKLCLRLLEYFEVSTLRREGWRDMQFPGGAVKSYRRLNTNAGCEYTVAITLDLMGADSLAVWERVSQLSKDFQWHILVLGFDALFHPQKLLAACKDAHVSIETFLPGREDDRELQVAGSAFGWGREGQPATVTFENGYEGFMTIRQRGRYGGDAPLETDFFDKLNPDTIIPLFQSAFKEPDEAS